MRCFEKISFEQFSKDISSNKNLYDSYSLPRRQTKNSAGYDFESVIDFSIEPGMSLVIPLGIKACMNSDEVLFLIIRSSLGFKNNIRMCNQVGVIDSDYYGNVNNEGHIFVKLQNESNEVFSVKRGTRICQGIFVKYLTIDNEEEINNERVSGIGSTN